MKNFKLVTILQILIPVIGFSCFSDDIENIELTNKKTVKKWLERGWNEQNADMFFEQMSSDFINHCTGRNLEKMKLYLKDYFNGNRPVSKVIIEDIIAEKNKVAIRLTHQNQGKENRSELVLCFFKNGKISEVWNSLYREFSKN